MGRACSIAIAEAGATVIALSRTPSDLNKLEKEKDKNKIWRKKVNMELKNNYKKIFDSIDKLIFLRVPSFKYVYKWRLLQEKKLKVT